jgi:hypothetical protein
VNKYKQGYIFIIFVLRYIIMVFQEKLKRIATISAGIVAVPLTYVLTKKAIDEKNGLKRTLLGATALTTGAVVVLGAYIAVGEVASAAQRRARRLTDPQATASLEQEAAKQEAAQATSNDGMLADAATTVAGSWIIPIEISPVGDRLAVESGVVPGLAKLAQKERAEEKR